MTGRQDLFEFDGYKKGECVIRMFAIRMFAQSKSMIRLIRSLLSIQVVVSF